MNLTALCPLSEVILGWMRFMKSPIYDCYTQLIFLAETEIKGPCYIKSV